jgi:hypothetical protein
MTSRRPERMKIAPPGARAYMPAGVASRDPGGHRRPRSRGFYEEI